MLGVRMKISVVISTYNRADKYLPEAIESILKQSFDDFELLIVDDASTDSTKKVVTSYMKDPRVKYFRMSENTGSDTRPKNRGAQEAQGKYLMFVDDDVRLTKNALELLNRGLDENDVDVVYGDMMVVHEDGKIEPGVKSDYNAQLLMIKNYIDTSMAMMRYKAFTRVGGFDTTLPKFVDWNLWVRMSKAGCKFKRISEVTLFYNLHTNTKSQRVKTETYMHPDLGLCFVPTFDPSGCKWHVGETWRISPPRVSIFTIHYDRLDYSKQTYKEMVETAGYPFTWYALDNGSKDGTPEWLEGLRKKGLAKTVLLDKNVGITKASNMLIDEIARLGADIIVKVDNDIEFQTNGWLREIVEMWKTNTMLYMSPYVEGLIHNPGGAPRMGYGYIGDKYVEVTKHIGGILAAISARAYMNFRWNDKMLHGSQDTEASQYFRKLGYMPCYLPMQRIKHRDGTAGQMVKYSDYFERRKKEKATEA